MASNREERLQMRQRGAGTRKIKEVNFGFSFGLAPPPEEPPQAASQPADVDISIEPPAALPLSSTSENTQPSLLSPEKQLPSSQDSGQLRTPGGARNSLPERPSTFDIPEDDALDLGRSGKRRKIEPPGQSPRASVEPEVTQQAKRDSPTFQNGVQTSAPVPSKPTEPRDEPLTMQSTTDVTQTEQTPKETLDPTTAMVSDNPAAEAAILEDEHPDQNGVNQKPTEPQKESSGADGTPEFEDTTNGKRKRRGSSAGQRRSQSIEQPETEAENAQHPALQEPSLDTNLDESMVADSLKSQSGKRSRGRPRTSVQSSPAMDEGSAQNEAASAESMPGQSIPTQQQTTTDSVANETQNGQPLDEGNVPEEDDTANSEGIRQSRQKSKATNDIQKQVGHPGKKAIELPESMEALGPAGEKRKQRRRLASEPEPEPGVESEGPKEPKPVGEKRKRGRMSKEEPEPEPEQQPQSEPQNEPEISKKPKPAAERRNRRKRSDQEPQPEPEVEPELEVSREPEPAIEKRKRGRRARGERVLEPEPERQPEVPEEPEPATEKRKRRRRSDQGSELEPEPERETQAEPDPVSPEEPKPAGEKRKRGRRSKEERVPEPEAERQPEAPEEPEPEPASAPKRSRGRPSLSHKGPEVTHREEDLAAQNENGEEASRTTRRKPRQPRGETVPVTVHRIANVASLGGHVRPSELSDEEEEEDSADELATRQKTKLPSRGGVNVADVLSQICRETLEKTLTTLKNGISNEGNAARRSEWTTKKKAVEAFGTELEGRLFELSEMLDSNFILGVKLKKAKREMMDMRSRLYQLRKERESVALQMDAVRRKHSEEENASQARTNINNSLHSLDLALERSQNRPAGESGDSGSSEPSLTVGLEFMLRSVADNVSSRAPGAQGGLLNQIKAFNAQLEAAARTLES